MHYCFLAESSTNTDSSTVVRFTYLNMEESVRGVLTHSNVFKNYWSNKSFYNAFSCFHGAIHRTSVRWYLWNFRKSVFVTTPLLCCVQRWVFVSLKIDSPFSGYCARILSYNSTPARFVLLHWGSTGLHNFLIVLCIFSEQYELVPALLRHNSIWKLVIKTYYWFRKS